MAPSATSGRPIGGRTKGDQLRFAVYTDYLYRRANGAVYAERAFALFLAHLERSVSLVVVGRLDPSGERLRYRLPEGIAFAALPVYPSLVHPAAILAMARSLRRFWRLLSEVDGVWLLGPHPLALAFAVLAAVRRKRIVLGVRQDFPAYVRSRHSARSWMYPVAFVLEAAYRLLARVCPVIVVGPDLARRYRHSPRVEQIAVSLVRESQIVTVAEASRRSYDAALNVLSVGRLEREKNPLLLAEILARLRREDRRWRLLVYGEGPLEPQLDSRLRELGVREHAELRGYVPLDGGLLDAYKESHAFLHVSWTEGLPQVVFEAFATGLPLVATAVGGVPSAVGDAALLIPPNDAEAAAASLLRVADEPALRTSMIESGIALARRHTLESECQRVTDVLEDSSIFSV